MRFVIEGDHSSLLKSLDGARAGVHKAAQDIEKEGMGIEDMFKRIGAAAGIAFSLEGAKSFIKQVVDMRSYFQDIESSMEVFLGGQEKASKFMSELKDAAYYNMFEFTDLANASKQLIAYKNDIDTVIPTIQKLSDIAVGTSAPLLDLVNLYNKAKSTGKVSTQDMYSWAVKGVVIKDVLKDMGEEASGTSVTFEQLNKVLDKLTSEGGMFYQLQEKQMENISAEIGQFQDNLSLMLNEIGEKYQDEITGVIKVGSELIDHYQEIARLIGGAVVAYGVYRVALATCLVIEKAWVYWKGLEAEATMMNTLRNAEETASVTALEIAKLRLMKTTKALTAAMMKNPWVLVAAAVATLAVTIYTVITAETELEKSQKKIDDALSNTKAQIKSEQAEIDRLFDKLKKAKEGTEEYKKVKDQILDKYGTYLKGLDEETKSLRNVEAAYKAITKAAREASIARGKEAALKDVEGTYGKTFGDTMKELQEKLTDKVGSKKTGRILRNLQRELEETGKVSAETARKIKDTLNKNVDDSFIAQQNLSRADQWISTLEKNEDYLQRNIQLVEERFQIEEEVSKHEDKKKIRNKEVIEDEKKALQAKLDNLSKEEAIGEKGAKLKEKINALNKELKAYSVDSKEEGKRVKAQEKLRELLDKQAREQARQAKDIELSTREAEIKAMDEGTDKTIAQIEYEYEREKEAIARSYEDLKIARIEAAKELWENDKKNEGKNFYDSDVFKKTDWDSTYTEGEIENRKAREEAASKARLRSIEEENSRQKQALYDYIKEYGSIQAQREAITKEYDEKIAEESDSIAKASLEQKKEELLQELNMKELQDELNWEQVFGDLSHYSTEALRGLKEKLRQALDAKDITAENAKVISEKIIEIEDRISEKSDIWASLIPGLKERNRLINQAKVAEEEYLKAVEKLPDAFEKVNAAQQNLVNQLQESGIMKADGSAYTQQELASMDVSDLEQLKLRMVEMGKDSGAVSDALKELIVSTTELDETNQDITKKRKSSSDLQSMLNGSSSIGDYFSSVTGGGEAAGVINFALTNAASLKELVDTIGLHDTEFGEAVGTFSEGCEGFQQAISSFQNGDIIGGVTGIIKGVQGWGSTIEKAFDFSFSGSNADEVRAENNRLIEANENLATSIDYLKETIDKEYGLRAAEAAESAKAKQQQYNENLLRQWENSMGYHDAHHSNSYYYDIGEENAKRISEAFGVNIRGDIWEDLMQLTPEQMDRLRKEMPDVWKDIVSQGEYDWVYESLEQYADQADKIKEINDQLIEGMLGTSAESVFDDFLNSLYDLADGATDVYDEVSDGWRKMVNKMVIDNLVGADFKEKLEKWAEDVAKLTEDYTKGEIDEATYKKQLDEYEKQREDYLRDAEEKVDAYKKSGVVQESTKDQQSATYNSAQNITYEQADALTGIGLNHTALMEQGNQTRDMILMNLQSLTIGIIGDGGLISLIATANSQRESIYKEMKGFVAKMESGFKDIVTELKNQ